MAWPWASCADGLNIVSEQNQKGRKHFCFLPSDFRLGIGGADRDRTDSRSTLRITSTMAGVTKRISSPSRRRRAKKIPIRAKRASEVLKKYDGPSVGLELKRGKTVAVGVKTGDEIEFLVLEGEFELPADLGRTLRKRIADSDDRRRYVIASALGSDRRHWFYYVVTSDSYVVGDLQSATAFKRRVIAEAVMALLRSEWHEIVECRRLDDGTLEMQKRRRR